MSVITPVDLEPITADHEPDDIDYAGWFCVRTDPWECAAPGCLFIATHLTVMHHIVVWPDQDDRMLLTYARDARQLGRNPSIEEYQPDFGPCVAYDAWVSAGRPVHGLHEPPEGWKKAWKPL